MPGNQLVIIIIIIIIRLLKLKENNKLVWLQEEVNGIIK
jgi:hypothetical protein